MARGYFITGTDTEVGKTYVTTKLLDYFNHQGFQTAAIKPIASGAKNTENGLRNEDGLLLQKHASIQFPYDLVNPYCLLPPIAPHIALAYQKSSLTVKELLCACQPILNQTPDITLIEGVGGWLVPLNHRETMADFAVALGFPVILVVGMKLGCINHSLLTFHHLQQSNIQIAGWIANCIDPKMNVLQENIDTLKEKLPIPLISTIPFQPEKVNINLVM